MAKKNIKLEQIIEYLKNNKGNISDIIDSISIEEEQKDKLETQLKRLKTIASKNQALTEQSVRDIKDIAGILRKTKTAQTRFANSLKDLFPADGTQSGFDFNEANKVQEKENQTITAQTASLERFSKSGQETIKKLHDQSKVITEAGKTRLNVLEEEIANADSEIVLAEKELKLQKKLNKLSKVKDDLKNEQSKQVKQASQPKTTNQPDPYEVANYFIKEAENEKKKQGIIDKAGKLGLFVLGNGSGIMRGGQGKTQHNPEIIVPNPDAISYRTGRRNTTQFMVPHGTSSAPARISSGTLWNVMGTPNSTMGAENMLGAAPGTGLDTDAFNREMMKQYMYFMMSQYIARMSKNKLGTSAGFRLGATPDVKALPNPESFAVTVPQTGTGHDFQNNQLGATPVLMLEDKKGANRRRKNDDYLLEAKIMRKERLGSGLDIHKNYNNQDTSFAKQEGRNKDRANQRSFVNMLIPELAKLLKKNPFMDLLKLGFLMLGKYFPKVSAACILWLPTIAALLGSKLARGIMGKAAGTVYGATFGKAMAKMEGTVARNAARGTSIGGATGWYSPNSVTGRLKALEETKVTARANAQKYLNRSIQLERGGRTGASEFAFEKALKYEQQANKASKTLNRFSKIRGAGAAKVFGKIPMVGALISAGMEIPGLVQAAKSGEKGAFTKQLGASAGGVTGGVVGGIAGAALGSFLGPVGTAIGGVLGAFLGDFLGRKIGGNLGPSLSKIGAAFKRLGSALKPVGRALMELGKKVADKLAPIFDKFAGAISGGIMKALDLFAAAIDGLASAIEWICKKLGISTAEEQQQQETVQKKKDYEEKKKAYEEFKPGSDAHSKWYKEELKRYKEAMKDPNLKQVDEVTWMTGAFNAEVKRRKEAMEAAKKLYDNAAGVQSGHADGSALGATTEIPQNVVRGKQHGVDAMDMRTMGLAGHIYNENSVPWIAAQNADNLKALDNFLTKGGHTFKYNSAMGGHAEGTAHWLGNKVDIGTLNKALTPAEYEELFKAGYFGGKTGALGYEYQKGQNFVTTPEEYKKLYNAGKVNMSGNNHYDLSIKSNSAIADAVGAATVAVNAERTANVATSSQMDEFIEALTAGKTKESKIDKARNIIFSATDVTGSLGVWGITQVNNVGGPMRIGK